MLKQQPTAMSRCKCIYGDLSLKDLGISEDDRELLIKEVNFIFNNAATTRFDDSIEYSIKVNALSTKYMLQLAEECRNLKVSAASFDG